MPAKGISFGCMKRYLPFLIILFIISSCKPEVYTPKPRGYYRVDLPEHEYRVFNAEGFPYKFEYPVYSEIINDTAFFGEKPENPYWVNIDFPSIGGRIYLSYKEISPSQTLERLNQDVYEMTWNVHNKKADYIQPFIFKDTIRNVYGEIYDVGGDAASAIQFYATDSEKNFIRGALYFNTTPNEDSLKPMNEFIKVDIDRLLRTLEWK